MGGLDEAELAEDVVDVGAGGAGLPDRPRSGHDG
jgi:hypothetical protein